MISDAEDQELEEKIFFDGEKRDYNYYLNSILASFVKHTGKALEVFATALEYGPLVIHIDDNYLGDYSHASHFVVVSDVRKDGKFEIIDPAEGKRKYLSPEKLLGSINSLKIHIKMCPIIIRVE